MRNDNRYYRKHMRLKTVLSTLAVILLVVIMLLAAVFFWFRRYIVYTEDGLYLDIPWLYRTDDDISPTVSSLYYAKPLTDIQ